MNTEAIASKSEDSKIEKRAAPAFCGNPISSADTSFEPSHRDSLAEQSLAALKNPRHFHYESAKTFIISEIELILSGERRAESSFTPGQYQEALEICHEILKEEHRRLSGGHTLDQARSDSILYHGWTTPTTKINTCRIQG